MVTTATRTSSPNSCRHSSPHESNGPRRKRFRVLAGLCLAALLCFPLGAKSHPDLSLLVVSDTHMGFDATTDHRNEKLVTRLQTMTGVRLPEGEVLPQPQGLFITGDLTENGGLSAWNHFERTYLHRASIPIFENFGNHDHHWDEVVLDRIRARHGDTNYAVDLGGVHCISLGEAPDARGLGFLEQNLRTCAPDQPILLFFHLPLLGPWAEGNWFSSAGLRERLWAILKGKRVLGIFHGHYHASGTYRWNGIHIYEIGSVKDRWRSFFAVRIQGSHMLVASWNLDSDSWWWWHARDLDTGKESLIKAPVKGVRAHPRLREWGK